MKRSLKKWYLSMGLLATVSSLPLWARSKTRAVEAERLAILMEWKSGTVVAEIGAGDGRLSLAAAERVGAAGHVFATELDPKKLAKLETLAATWKLQNITVVKAGVMDTHLPHECCDAVFLRGVYHHFTDPAKINASLFQALKPGGQLAVIDFPPRKLLSLFFPTQGVPKNRGGHGMPPSVLINELTAAGFQVVSVSKDWPGSHYCVIFRKPVAEPSTVPRPHQAPPEDH